MAVIPRTDRGYDFFEVASALQKAIRRAEIDEALYWAVELYCSGYTTFLWHRLLISSHADIGPADDGVVVIVRACYENFLTLREAADSMESERLPLVHAVYVLCSAAKTRVLDNTKIVAFADTVPRRNIPDYARDKDTTAGQRRKRGWPHFFNESTRLNRACPRYELAGDAPGPAKAAEARIVLEAGTPLRSGRGGRKKKGKEGSSARG